MARMDLWNSDDFRAFMADVDDLKGEYLMAVVSEADPVRIYRAQGALEVLERIKSLMESDEYNRLPEVVSGPAGY